MGCGAPHVEQGRLLLGCGGSVFRCWHQSTYGREKLTLLLQTATCTHNWHSPVLLPPLLPPQDICWNCTGSDQTPSKPNTAWHCRYLRVKEGANALIPPQVYFLSRQLEDNYFFLFFMPNTQHLTVFSAVIPPVWFWSRVNRCHSKHSVVPVQTEGEAPQVWSRPDCSVMSLPS